jgi:ferredoxin
MPQRVVFDADHFQQLLDALHQRGYQLVGPTVRDGVMVYDELTSVDDLPIGWTDTQQGGTYGLVRRQDDAFFGYAVGPHSWKKFLYPPQQRLWQAQRRGNGFQFAGASGEAPRYAFIGVRPCELRAIAVQDKVFMYGPYHDPLYAARRTQAFTVAVNCGQAGGTCFCVSMQTGPRATTGFDLALTEVLAVDRHFFVAEVGTAQGAEVLRDVPRREARPEELAAVEAIVTRAIEQMGRSLDTTDLKGLLYRNVEHPRWDEVAVRCLSCANCTMVCPTCFCTTVEDATDLTGEHAERWRRWDSCFTLDFSYLHGGSVRPSTRARYRHWLTHKLATWIDQFGTSGCVGCGRCITWCPVAIDMTEEVRAIRENEGIMAVAAEETQDGNA